MANSRTSVGVSSNHGDDDEDEAQQIPPVLWLSCPGIPGLTGGYNKVGYGRDINNSPIWVHRNGRCLYMAGSGMWAVARSKADARRGLHVGVESAPPTGEHPHPAALPHSVETWLVNGQEDPTTAVFVCPTDVVAIPQLLTHIIVRNKKSDHYKHLPYYMIYLIFLTFYTMITSHVWDWNFYNTDYYLSQGMNQKYYVTDLDEVTTDIGMWEWMEKVMPVIYSNVQSGNVQTPVPQTNDHVAYAKRSLVENPGITLDFRTLDDIDTCLTLCDRFPGCQSVAFSQDCQRCFLKDRCIDATTPASATATSCLDTASYYKTCNTTAASGGGVSVDGGFEPNTCKDGRVTLNMECRGVLGTQDFTCSSPVQEVRGEVALGGETILPVGVLLIRQWRVNLRMCDYAAYTPIPMILRKHLPMICAPQYHEDTSSTTPYGTNGKIFIPDADVDQPHRGPQVTTNERTYNLADHRFTEDFSYEWSADTALVQLAQLRNQWGFFDNQTRLIVLNTIVITDGADKPGGGLFAHVSFWFEFTETGYVDTGVEYLPFHVLHLEDGYHIFNFVLDVIFYITTLMLLPLYVRKVWVRRMLNDAAWGFYRSQPRLAAGRMYRYFKQAGFGFQDIVQVAHITMATVAAYFRIWLWSHGLRLSNDDLFSSTPADERGRIMYNELSEYSYFYSWGRCFIGITYIVAGVKLVQFFEFNLRLNKLSETTKYAASEVVAMTMLLFFIIFSYSLAALRRYGTNIVEFRTVGTSMLFFARLVFEAQINMDTWEDMKQLHPDTTWIFILSFYLIAWMLLLNMVIGIITGAFATVQNNIKSSNTWAPGAILAVLVTYTKAFFRGPQKKDSMKYRKGASSEGLRYSVGQLLFRDPLAMRARNLLLETRAWCQETKRTIYKRNPSDWDVQISYAEFRSLCEGLSPPMHDREVLAIFENSMNQIVSGMNAAAASQERKFEALEGLLDRLSTQLSTSIETRDEQLISIERTVRTKHQQTQDALDALNARVDELITVMHEADLDDNGNPRPTLASISREVTHVTQTAKGLNEVLDPEPPAATAKDRAPPRRPPNPRFGATVMGEAREARLGQQAEQTQPRRKRILDAMIEKEGQLMM